MSRKRTNIVKCVDQETKQAIAKDFSMKVFKTKTALGVHYGISLRTLNRVLSEFYLKTEVVFVYDYTLTKEAITIFRDDESRVITKGYPKFDSIKSDLIINNFSDVSLQSAFDLLSLPTFIDKFSEGNITVCHEEGSIFYGTFEIKNSLVDRMFDIMNRGVNVLPMVRFLDKLMDNPDENIVEQLYPFMQHNSIEINTDGDIKAYRNITKDYKDHHTNTMDNSIGTIVKLPRSLVDCNPENTCSTGIHAASYKYASTFEKGRLVEVTINPSHVCSVPVDYDGQKMRVSELTIVKELK